MPIALDCPSCGRKVRVPDRLLGEDVKCPLCQSTFTAASRAADDAPAGKGGPAPVSEGIEGEAGANRPRPRPALIVDDEEGWEDDNEADEGEGEEADLRRRYGMRRDLEPHRGGLILALGIGSVCLSVVGACCALSFLGVIVGPFGLGVGTAAWVMGHKDRRRMAAGQMDSTGRGTTTAGWICGIVGTCLGGLDVLCGAAMFIFFVSNGFK
jgi:hypothetical protein